MPSTYEATGPIDVGSPDGDVLHYEEGDVVPGAEEFENLAGLVEAERLRKRDRAATLDAEEETEPPTEEAPRKSPAKRSGSRSRSQT